MQQEKIDEVATSLILCQLLYDYVKISKHPGCVMRYENPQTALRDKISILAWVCSH